MHRDVQGFSSLDPGHHLLFPPMNSEPRHRQSGGPGVRLSQSWVRSVGPSCPAYSWVFWGRGQTRADISELGRGVLRALVCPARSCLGCCGQEYRDTYNDGEAGVGPLSLVDLCLGSRVTHRPQQSSLGPGRRPLPRVPQGRPWASPSLFSLPPKWDR